MSDVISRYFGLDAHRDTRASLPCSQTTRSSSTRARRTGTKQIRAWQLGPASKYVYTTEVLNVEASDPDRYLATGRLTGNFPGGTADLRWDFTVADDRIKRLVIAP
jgi:hypothetical protein